MVSKSSIALVFLAVLALGQTGCEDTIPGSLTQDYLFSEPGRDTVGTPLDHFEHFHEVLVDFKHLVGMDDPYFEPQFLDTVIVNKFHLEAVMPLDRDLSFLNLLTFYL